MDIRLAQGLILLRTTHPGAPGARVDRPRKVEESVAASAVRERVKRAAPRPVRLSVPRSRASRFAGTTNHIRNPLSGGFFSSLLKRLAQNGERDVWRVANGAIGELRRELNAV
jgi:hypothetical protein